MENPFGNTPIAPKTAEATAEMIKTGEAYAIGQDGIVAAEPAASLKEVLEARAEENEARHNA